MKNNGPGKDRSAQEFYMNLSQFNGSKVLQFIYSKNLAIKITQLKIFFGEIKLKYMIQIYFQHLSISLPCYLLSIK